MAKDWAGDQAERVGRELKRLRGRRSGQWLSDRTAELGYRVPRTTISELENGKRKYVSTAELAILARALDTAPVALLYPPPYQDDIELLPGQSSTSWSAAEWFSGMSDGAERVALADDVEAYDRNLARLRAAARISELTTRKQRLMDAIVGADEAVQAAMLDAINGVQDDIDRLSNAAG
ncbi:MAG TPA: helix-turn-helix transcriptional regulator [Mycobacterium sp.]|uniref:helix-turn-helix transcriptional regulator n=1 Tax=Mycobacterium sp. TaxID=1785 RepID=UPI002CC24F4B|nr:helix-turn-helix transcriptional regulator [Mycobacterium sp.]HME74272.1 helix-turn-helix transcriptional regulator [Mycobacterium sp.]